jgi:hypothetical protein
MRQTFPAGCASAASGTASRPRMSVTMHRMTLYHMVVSSGRPYANLLLFMEAEQQLKRTFFLEKCLETEMRDISISIMALFDFTFV